MAAEPRNERRFAAMGSTAHVIVHGGPHDLVDDASRRIAELERRWSRFIATSDVSLVNAAGVGEAVPVHDDTLVLIERAIDGWRASGGRFDPMLLAQVRRAGYDHSLVDGSPDGSGPSTDDGAPTVDAFLEIDLDASTVRRTGAATFDPGGLGKGLAADIVSAEIMCAGALGVMINLGGDLRVRGVAPDGGPWRIDIENPRQPGISPLATLLLHDGAVATTSRMKRRWTTDDGPRHHLIDPATGESADTPVMAATVVAGEGWQAEVLAKVAFLDGFRSDDGFERIERLGAAALIVTDDVDATTSRWVEFAAPTGQPVGSAA